MKALILLATAGLGTLVAWPHLPDSATIKKEMAAVLASASAQLSQASQPTRPVQTAAPNQTAPAVLPALPPEDETAANNPSATPATFIAKASSDDVRRKYGEPEHIEKSVYGETWYYPVYIIYFRNGYVHRVPRTATGTSTTASRPVAPATAVLGGPAAAATPQPQPWRFSNHSSLGTVTLGGYGVQQTSPLAPEPTTGAPATATVVYSSRPTYPTYYYISRPAGSVSTGSSTCNRPTAPTTAAAAHPVVVQRTAPTTSAAPVYSRPMAVGN